MRVSAWALVSQLLNSGTNLMISIRLAQVLSPADFGRISIVVVIQFLLISAARSWAVDPMARLLQAASRPDDRLVPAGFGSALGITATLTGAATGVLSGALDVPIPLLAAFVALAVLGTAHDSMRAALLINHSAKTCALADAMWFLVQLTVLVAAAFLGRSSATIAVTAACLGAATALVPLAMTLRHVPRTTEVGATSGDRIYWLAEQVLGGGLLPFATVALAVSAGYSASAAFRGALLLMGPATIMVAGLRQPVLGWLSRLPPQEVRRQTRRLALLVAIFAATLTLPILLVPGHAGRLLLGDVWGPAYAVLPAVIVQRIAGSAAEAFLATNRGFGEPTHAVIARAGIVSAIVLWALAMGKYGIQAAVWGIAVLAVAWLIIADRIAVRRIPA